MREHESTSAATEGLANASALDPEVLQALPAFLRAEVLENEARERRLREDAGKGKIVI